MARYETTIKNDLPPAEAFVRVADLSRLELWDPGVTKSEQVSGDGIEIGSSYDVSVKTFAGRSMTLTYVVTEFTENERMVAIADDTNLRSYDIISVKPDGDGGSALTYDAELELKGFFRPGNLLLGLAFNRIGDAAAAGLRTYLVP